jgi:tetratricopeptide (TPR) repeat protein
VAARLALTTFQCRQGLLLDWVATWQHGLTAAYALDDTLAQVTAHFWLGRACADLGRYSEAADHLQCALAGSERAADLAGEVRTHLALAWVWEHHGDDRHALEHAVRGLELLQTTDDCDPALHARALNAVGWQYAQGGQHAQAREHLLAALALREHHDDRSGLADALDSLGYVEHHTGHHDQALDYYRQALDLYRDTGDTYSQADTLDHLGHTLAALDRPVHACEAWQHALRLFTAQHRTGDADRLRRLLETL